MSSKGPTWLQLHDWPPWAEGAPRHVANTGIANQGNAGSRRHWKTTPSQETDANDAIVGRCQTWSRDGMACCAACPPTGASRAKGTRKQTMHQSPKLAAVTKWIYNYTPYKLSRMHTTIPLTCWWECSSTGLLIHILWNCQSVRSYWNKIFTLISEFTPLPFFSSADMALLHINITSVPLSARTTVIHI